MKEEEEEEQIPGCVTLNCTDCFLIFVVCLDEYSDLFGNAKFCEEEVNWPVFLDCFVCWSFCVVLLAY